MAAALCDLTELKRFIPGTPASDDTLLQELLDDTEDLLVRDCGRRERPFAAALSNRTEVHDGIGESRLYLHYPIGTLTSVKIGRDTSDPEEELDIADLDVLIYVAGKRLLERVDGGVFGTLGDPRSVHVTYDTQADLPAAGTLPLKRVVAAVYRQRGVEDASREAIGGYSRDIAKVAESDPIWQRFVQDQLVIA